MIFYSFCYFFSHKCKNPHSLVSTYNVELLKRHGLHDLTEKQLFQLLLQNDPYLLPEVGCPGGGNKNLSLLRRKLSTFLNKLSYIFVVIRSPSVCTPTLHCRFAHITTRATVCTVPAGSPPPASSFTSASTISRVSVSLDLPVRGPISSVPMKWRFSEDSVRRILKTFVRSTETNSSSWDNRREEPLRFLVKNKDLYKKLNLKRVVVCTIYLTHICVPCSAATGKKPNSAVFPQQSWILHKFCLST